MNRICTTVLLCFLLLAGAPLARSAEPPTETDKGAYLGVLFGPLSEVLYDQLPQLPRNQGVLVTQVLTGSPADKAGLHRNDILLEYDGEKIRDCEDLVRLIQGDKPDRTVQLTYLRGGKKATTDAALVLGPAIKTARESRPGPADDVAPGIAKPGGPAKVSVAATPLENGRLKVTIEYYPEGLGRLKSLTCEGDSDQINDEVNKQLPARERNLVQVALKHIRDLNSQKPPDKAPEKP